MSRILCVGSIIFYGACAYQAQVLIQWKLYAMNEIFWMLLIKLNTINVANNWGHGNLANGVLENLLIENMGPKRKEWEKQ